MMRRPMAIVVLLFAFLLRANEPAPDKIAAADGMPQRLIPAGEFIMGADDADAHGRRAEFPPHRVEQDAYWIDRHEVTNAQYADFLNRHVKGNIRHAYACCDFGNPACRIHCDAATGTYTVEAGFADHPVCAVSWQGADAYARAVGRRLPTEAEWERAARGTDQRRYPWGNDWDPAKTATRESGVRQTTPVGAMAGDRSPCGAWDMAGNVREWVKDTWNADYYAQSPRLNPCNTAANSRRVVRGGAWCLTEWDARTTSRQQQVIPAQRRYSGFRCAETVPEPLPAAVDVGEDVLFYAAFDGAVHASAAKGERRPAEVAGPIRFVDGQLGQAALLGEDADRQYWIEYRSLGNIELSQGTITFRVQPRGWGGAEPGYRFFFLMRGNEMCNFYIYCYPNGNLLALLGRGVNREWVIASRSMAAWEDGQWLHVGVTWTVDEARLYVNGKPVSRVEIPPDRRFRDLPPTFRIGQSERWDPDQPPAQTAIDDFVIFARPLTDAEMAADAARLGAPAAR